MVEGAEVSGAVYQALSHGQTIGSGHAISVTAYFYNQQVSYSSTTCLNGSTLNAPTTVYGSANPVLTIRLGSASGTVEATTPSISGTYNSWTSETASVTTPSAGVYYATLQATVTGVTVHNAYLSGHVGAIVCNAGTDTTGYGNAYIGNITTSG
jgi:hypothetical protein